MFFFIAALWAYYHLVKQHYGFMVLYKKKNNDLAPIDNALDRLLLLFAFNYPFVAFIANDPDGHGPRAGDLEKRGQCCRASAADWDSGSGVGLVKTPSSARWCCVSR